MAATGRAAWIGPFALCCALMILFLIASTIVLALIPVYLAKRNFDFTSDTSDSLVDAAFASNLAGGRSLTLSNIGDVSNQIVGKTGLTTGVLNIDQGNFVPNTAAARKKRQATSGSTITCERATGLLGDIFVARFRVKYPSNCFIATCRQRFLSRAIQAIQLGNQNITVQMNFTTGQTESVVLQFCSFLSLSAGGCVNATRSNIYLVTPNNAVYQLNPNTLNATLFATVNCSSTSTLYSIAVQRDGVLWALYQDGSLYFYSIASQQCLSTNFQANQSTFALFKMTFFQNVNNVNEQLFVSKQNANPSALGEINLSTLALTSINNLTGINATSVDLASTTDGRLFGLFRTTPYTLGQINVANGTLISQTPLNVTASTTSPSSGLVSFNNQLYLFEANGVSTNIHLINITANSTSKLTNIPQVVLGAAASTCLGT